MRLPWNDKSATEDHCIFRAKVTKEYGITYQGKRAN